MYVKHYKFRSVQDIGQNRLKLDMEFKREVQRSKQSQRRDHLILTFFLRFRLQRNGLPWWEIRNAHRQLFKSRLSTWNLRKQKAMHLDSEGAI